MIKLTDKSLLEPEAAFINGQWVAGSATFEILDPATWRPIARVPDLGETNVNNAVDGAVQAAAKLKAMTGKKTGEHLRAWYSLVENAQEDLANVITSENGKTIAEARGEVSYAADFIDWFAGEAPRIDGSTIPASNPSYRVVTIKQPVGVCGIVTPWNFPAAMVTRKVAAALAAGCPCVVKPSPDTPLTALVLANLASRAGFPPGALSVVTTKNNTVEVGRVLTQHPAIRKFSFTGSTAVGKFLAAQCTGTVKRVSLELGGNAPFIVFDDANLQKAADAIMTSKFRLSGQTCVCANRIYVQHSAYDRLASLLVKRIERVRLGPGLSQESTMGPLITKAAVEKVDAHVKDALEKGSRALIGGQPETSLGGAFFQPTLLVDVPTNALCAREETFGPLLPMFRFDTDEDAVKLANTSEAGLAGYFFTERVSRAWKVAEALEVGMVGVNTGIISDAASPFGGIKASGLGREGLSVGIDEYLEIKSITFGLDDD